MVNKQPNVISYPPFTVWTLRWEYARLFSCACYIAWLPRSVACSLWMDIQNIKEVNYFIDTHVLKRNPPGIQFNWCNWLVITSLISIYNSIATSLLILYTLAMNEGRNVRSYLNLLVLLYDTPTAHSKPWCWTFIQLTRMHGVISIHNS